jgi:hypothetical protein
MTVEEYNIYFLPNRNLAKAMPQQMNPEDHQEIISLPMPITLILAKRM